VGVVPPSPQPNALITAASMITVINAIPVFLILQPIIHYGYKKIQIVIICSEVYNAVKAIVRIEVLLTNIT
jgi:hypothetical protein